MIGKNLYLGLLATTRVYSAVNHAIPFQKLLGDQFGPGQRKKKLGILWGSFRGVGAVQISPQHLVISINSKPQDILKEKYQ